MVPKIVQYPMSGNSEEYWNVKKKKVGQAGFRANKAACNLTA